MSKKSTALFASSLFTGLFFVFGLKYGIDPSDVKGTLTSQLQSAFFPQAQPILNALGFLLAFVSFLGLIALVRDEWDRDWQRGVAVASGLLAGGMTVINANLSIPFWLIGIVISPIPDQS